MVINYVDFVFEIEPGRYIQVLEVELRDASEKSHGRFTEADEVTVSMTRIYHQTGVAPRIVAVKLGDLEKDATGRWVCDEFREYRGGVLHQKLSATAAWANRSKNN